MCMLQESYGGLPFKVLTFLKAVMALYNPAYVYKVDDDVYLRLDRVPPAVAQWQAQRVGAYALSCTSNSTCIHGSLTKYT